jgi:hypothetical protein
MSDVAALSRQRCFHHPEREAVCRCTGCLRSFCRECVVDHEGRVLCVACLPKQVETVARRFGGRTLLLWLSAGAGFLAAWAFFYMAGQLLMGVSRAWDDWGLL